VSLIKLLLFFLNNQKGENNFLGEPAPADPAPADPAPADPAPADPAPAPADPAPAYNFPDGVTDPQVLEAGDTMFKNFWKEGALDIPNVLKSYVNTQRLLGQDKMIKPNKNFTDDDWAKHYQDSGVPVSADEYIVENNLSEGLSANEDLFNGFKDVAHKAGVLPKQAQAISDYFNNSVAEQQKAIQGDNQVRLDADIGKLKQEWGMDYTKNLDAAMLGLKQFADEAQISKLAEMGFMDNTLVTRLFSKIGLSLGEDTLGGSGENNTGMTEKDVRDEIASMYKPESPFKNRNHPDNKAYVARMLALQEKLHGGGVANANTMVGSQIRG
jgi:hypothetical protein